MANQTFKSGMPAVDATGKPLQQFPAGKVCTFIITPTSSGQTLENDDLVRVMSLIYSVVSDWEMKGDGNA